MDRLSWMIQASPNSIVLHDRFAIKEANDGFKHLSDLKGFQGVDLDVWLRQQFKAGAELDQLLEGISQRKKVQVRLAGQRKGIKFMWSIYSLPLTGDQENANEQVSWFVDESLAVVQNAYWELNVRMSVITSQLMKKDAQLAGMNLELKKLNEQLGQDIVDIKRAEQVLQEREMTLRAITDSAQDAILMMDHEGNLSFWNPAAEKIFGWTREEALGKNLHALLAPTRYHEAHQRAFPQFRMTGQGAAVGKTLELYGIRKDQSEFPFELSLSAIQLGGKWQAVGIVRDITGRKKAEAALKESEEWLSTLLRSIGDGVIATDARGNIVFVNAVAENLTGWTQSEAVGKYLDVVLNIVNEQTRQRVDSPLAQVLEKGIVVGLANHTVLISKSGKEIPLNDSGAPIKNAKGEIIGVVIIFQDVTERRRTEDAMQAMHQKLQQAHAALKESTAQLVQTEKMTALGELTAGVAHELNQPLNVTKIICQSILRDIQKGRFSAEEAKNDLPEIVKQMNKMADIIAHMRIFTRRSDGSDRTDCDVSALTNDVLKLVTQQFKDHNIQMTVELAEGLPHVWADQVRIEQVLLNILNNARYAVEGSGKREMKIEIKTYARTDQKELAIEIADNGIGIPDEVKTKLFQPFFTTKDPGQGTGLGLSVCRKIMEEHQGKVEFESRSGEGSIFRVILPEKAQDSRK